MWTNGGTIKKRTILGMFSRMKEAGKQLKIADITLLKVSVFLCFWASLYASDDVMTLRQKHKDDDTYTSVSMAWSLATLEKWDSRMETVPVRATWPHPQNRATPEKQRIVATSDAYGTPPKHLMQHSKQPVTRKERIVYYTPFFSKPEKNTCKRS